MLVCGWYSMVWYTPGVGGGRQGRSTQDTILLSVGGGKGKRSQKYFRKPMKVSKQNSIVVLLLLGFVSLRMIYGGDANINT